jgi:hypothetical protein
VDERNRETWMSGCFRAGVTLAAGMVLAVGAPPAAAQQVAAPAAPAEPAFEWAADPRIGLAAGWDDAGTAAWNLELRAHLGRPGGFFNPAQPGDGGFSNTDLAFTGNHAIVGNYHGFNIYDISNPADPSLRVSVVCPGGQGDVSVFGDLVFMSVQETRSRIDCGTGGAPGDVNPERFRGVRIFDIATSTTRARWRRCRRAGARTRTRS